MAENNSMDNFDIQQENDFEKISAPGSASDQEGDGLQPADEPLDSKPKSQDGEVSTTTETNSGAEWFWNIWMVTLRCWLKGVDPRVIDLIYWRDVKKTGVVFGTMLTVLLCLAIFSLVSVLAYLSLALLTVSFSFVVYKKIMAAVQKSNDGHPFKCLLDMDISLKEDKLKPVIQALLNNVNATMSELRRLFFIEDIVDSIKFGLMLWVCTYLGCLLNGMTLIILALIMLFSLPKVYETYQVQIDNYIGLAKAQLNSVITTVQNKLPFLKKKEKAQ